MDPQMQSNIMRYFIDGIEQEDHEVRIWMRGDNPERDEESMRTWQRVGGEPRKKNPPQSGTLWGVNGSVVVRTQEPS
jgi:hypothetical protein